MTPIPRRRVLAAGAALGAVFLAGGVVFVADAPVSGLSATERRVIEALAGTLYPTWASSGGDRVASYVDWYLSSATDGLSARLLRSLLTGLEWGALFTAGARFTRLSPDRRARLLATWEGQASVPARSAFMLLKMVVSMACFESPELRLSAGIVRPCGRDGLHR